MSKKEKAEKKFKDRIIEFGFNGDVEYSNDGFKELLRHARNVARRRALLNDDAED